MPSTADFLRMFMAAGVVGMAMLAVFFLRSRRLPLADFLAWGMLLVMIPVLGPFLVILARPGQPRQRLLLRHSQRVRPVPQVFVFLADRWLQKLRLH